MAMEGDVEPSLSYRCGVRSRWLLGDLNRLILAIAGNKKGGGARGQELISFIKHDRRTRLEIEQLRDIHPALYEYRVYAVDMIRAAADRLLHRSSSSE
jgi:hypothetical protein